MHLQHFYGFSFSSFYKLWHVCPTFPAIFFPSVYDFQSCWLQPVWQRCVFIADFTSLVCYQQAEKHKGKWGNVLQRGMFWVFGDDFSCWEVSEVLTALLWISLAQEMSHVDMLGVYAWRMNSHLLLIVQGDLFENEWGWRSDSCCHSSRTLMIELLYIHTDSCAGKIDDQTHDKLKQCRSVCKSSIFNWWTHYVCLCVWKFSRCFRGIVHPEMLWSLRIKHNFMFWIAK